MKTSRIAATLIFAANIAACNAGSGGTEEAGINAAPVMVDLRVRDNADAPYVSVNEFTVPASHEIGDGMMPYEGIGWENGLVGYRLYLDGRLVSDIFGKQAPGPALGTIAEYGSYHTLAPWGMDVLKVGPSLGLGGIGIMRGDQPEQFGAVPELSASITQSGETDGAFTISAGGIAGPSGGTGGFVADYSIGSDSPLTRVKVTATGALPLATGVVMHDGAQFLQSGGADGAWRYVATWGDTQSENKDALGMALFYRTDEATYGGLANSTHYIAFGQPEFEYAFLAAWELDPSGVKSREAFEALLTKELAALEGATE
ncbi:DUF4861 domain-containing protein [Erythrobacter insulae]|uniref:DUF4861 domain-containing protein n=1 Tax=Erythrobacter insulae TaxID=2584124 RepID=A0A547PD82_9SPHN|nr:DUF4861 family protein [Erythrobacter insulae]TRD12102.1 DUF4861 domain-containing protein [Erythrobacter insulae]